MIKLAELTFDNIESVVTSAMRSADFKALPDNARKELKNVQYCGFEGTVKMAIANLRKPDDSLHIYCDESEEYSEMCVSLYLKMKRRNPILKRKCVGLTFADDEYYSPLQAADMIAYCLRADNDRASRKPQPIIETLISVFRKGGVSNKGWLTYRGGTGGLGHGVLEPDDAPPSQ